MMNVFYLSKKLFACGVVLFLLLIPGIRVSHAQSTNKFIRKGNKLYEKQQFTDAEAEYKKALSKDSVSAAGLFNLGNSLYQQKRYGEALEQYAASAKNSAGGLDQSAASYNMGNALMAGKKWEQAIQAYKQSLIKNPSDDQARYNLAYAQEMLKKQKNGGGGKNNKQQNKDQNNKQNQKNQQQDQNKQNKDQQDKQNQQNQQQDKDQDQQQKHPQPQPSNIDKQRAEQLLNAAAQAEKKLQEEKDKKQKGIPVYNGKDW